MRHGSLFSGIGGFDLAAQWMGWENVFHCEIEEFPRNVLNYYWPQSISYNDITKTDFSVHRGDIDLITGGFPCQPFSHAGARKGTNDSRYLWPEMLRAIREIRPRWIVGENVYGLVSWDGGLVFDTVCADLENEGFQVIPIVLPAASVNAPHNRARIWFIANARNSGDSRNSSKIQGKAEEKDGFGTQSSASPWKQIQLFDESNFVFGDASQDPIIDGLLFREFNKEGTEVWQQRNTSTGDTERVCGEEMAGHIADSERIGFYNTEENGNIQIGTRTAQGQGSQFTIPTKTNGNGRDASDSGHERLQRNKFNESFAKEKREQGKSPITITESYKIKNWEQFPTVSPICNGDDGISDRLDSITFSKWRKESIKGGGNAVVPQLVYRIFKTIEEYEKTIRHPSL